MDEASHGRARCREEEAVGHKSAAKSLAGLLIESLEGEPDPAVDAAWAAEIEKRVAELDAGTAKTVPWDEVRQYVIDRLSAR